MKRLHARYPFLEAAREAVQALDADLADLIASDDSAILERGVDRVESAISEGTVGQERRRPHVELLSYPVARAVVSLVGQPELVRVYSRAEAVTARERFVTDLEGDRLKSTADGRITLPQLLRALDLSEVVDRVDEDRFHVDVGTYLMLSEPLESDEWRLATRDLSSGVVPVTREELYALLTEAVRVRIGERLPLSVPETVAEHLADEVQRIEAALADRTIPHGIDMVVPELFPPCVKNLISRVTSDQELPDHSTFSLVAFLAETGLETDEMSTLCDLDPGSIDYRTDRIRSDAGTDYAPPSCETMVAYGDCVNKDELCLAIDHPLEYYERRLDAAEDPTDWRNRSNSDAD